MTRESAKEKRERVERELAEERRVELVRISQEYPKRFRTVLSEALETNFELRAVDIYSGQYLLNDLDNNNDYIVYDTFENTNSVLYSIELLEDSVQRKKKQQEETRRKYELRVATLAKLTKEEREALGV